MRAWSLLTQDIATSSTESSNGGETTGSATHRAYTVIKREGQDDYWLNLGLVFGHQDGKGFNIVLQALPLDGKIVCREITDDDEEQPRAPAMRQQQSGRRSGERR